MLRNIPAYLFLVVWSVSLLFRSTTLVAENDSALYFPQKLSDSNTSITFEVDSTWHMVHGKTNQIGGRIWLADPADYTTVRGQINLPVKSFDTDNSMRDSKMKDILIAETYPLVQFSITGVTEMCDPEKLELKKECPININGDLTIKDVIRPLKIPAIFKIDDSDHIITGKTTFSWEKFGVEDPSIFIASVEEEMTVFFDIHLAKTEPKTIKDKETQPEL